MDRRGGEQPIPRPDDWEELDPAPWFTHLATPTLKAIENVLDGYQPTEVESRSKLLKMFMSLVLKKLSPAVILRKSSKAQLLNPPKRVSKKFKQNWTSNGNFSASNPTAPTVK